MARFRSVPDSGQQRSEPLSSSQEQGCGSCRHRICLGGTRWHLERVLKESGVLRRGIWARVPQTRYETRASPSRGRGTRAKRPVERRVFEERTGSLRCWSIRDRWWVSDLLAPRDPVLSSKTGSPRTFQTGSWYNPDMESLCAIHPVSRRRASAFHLAGIGNVDTIFTDPREVCRTVISRRTMNGLSPAPHTHGLNTWTMIGNSMAGCDFTEVSSVRFPTAVLPGILSRRAMSS